MLLTPDGRPAGKIDRTMLLAMWARKLQDERRNSKTYNQPIITAGLGRPTFPVNECAARTAMQYWRNILNKSQQARHLLDSDYALEDIINLDAVINYGDPQGDIPAREKMATALTRWYSSKVNITAENILFNVGGVSALHIIFKVINKKHPQGVILTPFPHYSLYVGADHENNLFPIPVMEEKGYQLTANLFKTSLNKALQVAEANNQVVSAFLLCDPNNPLGTIADEIELAKIADILRQHPNILIVLDEAYAEMRLDGKKHISILRVAPDLKERVILIRSATKALSSAGERMAVTVAFDNSLMNELIQESVNIYGHAPRSLQYAFAEAMDQLDEEELLHLNQYYRQQTEYVFQRLKNMGAALPDKHYHIAGSFYAVGNFSELFGLVLPADTQRALNKTGIISGDEDVAYYLLFNDSIMISPLSYCGLSPQLGYLRITCSSGKKELAILMDRLEHRLHVARKIKKVA